MIIPPVGTLQPGLGAEGLAQGSSATGAQGAAGVGSVGGLAAGEGAQAAGTPSFGSTLTEAISSLEGSQTSAEAASQSLATGNVADPEAAVSTVEDASLEMQLAAQIRAKASEAVQTIFQTQV